MSRAMSSHILTYDQIDLIANHSGKGCLKVYGVNPSFFFKFTKGNNLKKRLKEKNVLFKEQIIFARLTTRSILKRKRS